MATQEVARFLEANGFQSSEEALAALIGEDGGVLYGSRDEALLRWGSRRGDVEEVCEAADAAAPVVEAAASADEAATSPACVKEGWLQKKGDGFAAGWKDRFFALDGAEVAYFADGERRDRKGAFAVGAIVSVRDGVPYSHQKRVPTLEVEVTSGRVYALFAGSFEAHRASRGARTGFNFTST